MVITRLATPLLLLFLALVSGSTSIRSGIPKNSSSEEESYSSISRLRRLAVEFFDQYQNITILDLSPDLYLDQPSAEDLRCLADLQILANDVAAAKIWALKSKFVFDRFSFRFLNVHIKCTLSSAN